MDIILILFLVSVAVFLRPARLSDPQGGAVRDDYLSVENTRPLRGILAVTIILHHMAEKTSAGGIFRLLLHAGYLGVGLFFFLSGYGLMIQYKKKKETYLNGYWKKRILYLFIIYALATALYGVVLRFFIGEKITVLSAFISLFNGKSIVSNSWYLSVQFLLYIVFWFSFKFIKNTKYAILSVFIMQIIMTVVFVAIGISSIWYISNFPFVVGIIWAEKKEKIDGALSKSWFKWFALAVLAFAVFSALPLINERIQLLGSGFRAICRIISVPILAVLCVVILFKVRIKSKAWSRLGDISLEIYILHGLVITVLKKFDWFVQNPTVWTVTVLAATIPIAFACSIINKKIKAVLR